MKTKWMSAATPPDLDSVPEGPVNPESSEELHNLQIQAEESAPVDSWVEEFCAEIDSISEQVSCFSGELSNADTDSLSGASGRLFRRKLRLLSDQLCSLKGSVDSLI